MSIAEDDAARQEALRLVRSRSPSNPFVGIITPNKQEPRRPDAYSQHDDSPSANACSSPGRGQGGFGAGGGQSNATAETFDWIHFMQYQSVENNRRIQELKHVVSEVENLDEDLQEAQLQSMLAEEEAYLLREEVEDLREKVKLLNEKKLRSQRAVTGLQSELNTLERLVMVESRRRAAALSNDPTMSAGVGGVTKSEVRSIFCNYAIPDGTGNCLPVSNLLDVFKELWIAHGYQNAMPASTKTKLIQEFERNAISTGLVLWQEFWENYGRIWRTHVLGEVT